MSGNLLKAAVFAVALGILGSLAFAAERPIPPPPSKYAVDEQGILKPATVDLLSSLLALENQRTSNQIILAVFKDLGDEDLVAWTSKVFKGWAIGKKGKDNGVLLALYWKEHLIRIEVGYGLEGDLTDIRAKRIISDVLVPVLRQNRPDEALLLATREILAAIKSPLITSGDFDRVLKNGGYPVETLSGQNTPLSPVVWVLLLVFIGLVIWVRIKAGPQGWAMGRRGRKGGWPGPGPGDDNWWSGGGGSSGGGFSGGGGSSGGGGASGRW
ncbi:MAG: TPM domain-containing protein [Bdellovibrio sp.]|nr:TPM domain-containing protein [Bdellovibrio sp.]